MPAILRRDDVVIPATYSSQNNSPQPGVVVGIVLACVGGFLLCLVLLYSILGWAPITLFSSSSDDATTVSSSFHSSVLSRRTRSILRQGKSRYKPASTVSGDTEMYEVRTTTKTSRRTEPPIVVAPGPSRSSRPPPRVVEESSDDEVVVIEEHSPPRRHSRRDSSSRMSDERRYRDSDRGSRRDSRRYSRG